MQGFCWIFASSFAPIIPRIGLYELKYKDFSIIQCTLVILDGGHFPDCQLKRCSRKRQQEQFLLRKARCPAILPFLKGLVVECFQFLMDCFIQFRKGQELTVTQGRQDPCGGHANGPLHKSLVLGTAGTGRENGGTVVLRHLLVGLVEHCFRSGILHHAGLEVIRREDAGDWRSCPLGWSYFTVMPGLNLRAGGAHAPEFTLGSQQLRWRPFIRGEV